MRIFPNSVLIIISFLISLTILASGTFAEGANLIRKNFKQNLEICRLVVEGDMVLEATPEKVIAPADISVLRARWDEVSYPSAEHIIRYIDSSPFFLVLTRWRAGSSQFLGKIPSSNGCIVAFQLALDETGKFFVASASEQSIANCELRCP